MEQIPDIIHESWHPFLQPLFDDPKMKMIRNDFLPKAKFYPVGSDIFRVFAMPLDKIKVVILGQDPYNNGEAIGFAFAVAPRTRIPKSLDIIRNEIIESKVERDTHTNIDSDEWRTLKHWRQQGVFLLNTALTVEVKAAGSHYGIWQWFTRAIIGILSMEVKAVIGIDSTEIGGKAFGVIRPVWLLWGSKAKSFKDYINNPYNGVRPQSEVDAGYKPNIDLLKEFNIYLEADHPAAETYPNSKYKFTGCNHFKLCNDILKSKGQHIINW